MTLILVGLGWLCGLVGVATFAGPWWIGAGWLAAAFPVLVLRAGLDWRVGASATIAAALSGLLMANAMTIQQPAVADFIGQDVEVVGRVVSEPDPGRVSTGYDIEIESLTVGSVVIENAGVVRATLHQYAEHLPGDRLTLTGELLEAPVFGGFDYRSYLQQQGVWATMLYPRTEVLDEGGWTPSRALTQLRLELDRSLQRVLPEPEASLGAGIAFGRDGNLSMERKEAYNASGLRHLTAVSGSNIVLVTSLTMALAVPLVGRRYAWAPAALTLAAYLLVAGASPSVIRAGVMAGILLLGGIIGRPQSGLPALAGAFIVMTAIDARDALQPGFQLSMAATAGIITIAPWLSHFLERASARLPRATLPQWTCEVAAISFTASVVTAPIMWFHFGELSLVGPFANVLVQPVMLVAFWLTIATAAAGTFSESMSWWFSLGAYYPLAYVDSVASMTAAAPFATLGLGEASPSEAAAAILPIALAAGVAYRWLPPVPVPSARLERQRRVANRWVASATVGAFVFAAVPVSLLPMRDTADLRIDFLDVGQGDAILLTLPGGQQLLVDGGPSGIELARQLSAAMPHWDRTIDYVLVSHPQEDHIGGLPELFDRYGVTTLYGSGHENNTRTFAALVARGDAATVLTAGERLRFGDVVIDVLWPPAGANGDDLNNVSVVLRVTYGDVVVLLPGDIEREAQRELLATGGAPATVLKVPHHGSKTSDPAFFAAVNPSLAVIQAGADNRFGHPHAETLDALTGTRLYRTDLQGRVTVTTDGRSLKVRTER